MTQGQLDESKGLLDAVSMEGPEPEPSPEDTIINHRSEDTSPIPEEVPAKFVKDNVVDIVSLAKSYKELEGKFRSNLHKVPEEGYDLSVATAAGVPEDDEVLKAYAGWAKEAGISQEYFNQLASTVLKNAGAQEAQSEFDAKAEIESLGPNAQAIIDDQVDWARKLVKTGTWELMILKSSRSGGAPRTGSGRSKSSVSSWATPTRSRSTSTQQKMRCPRKRNAIRWSRIRVISRTPATGKRSRRSLLECLAPEQTNKRSSKSTGIDKI
jgi:hypothetical protein